MRNPTKEVGNYPLQLLSMEDSMAVNRLNTGNQAPMGMKGAILDHNNLRATSL